MSFKKSFVGLCCFISLLLSATLIIVLNVLPKCGVRLNPDITDVLGLIRDVATLFGIAFGAFGFCRRSKGLFITYWIAVVIFAACAVVGVIRF